MQSASVSTPHAPLAPATAPGRSPLDDMRLRGRLWRGSSLVATTDPTLPSGFASLDAELPGGGWPLRAVTELLTPQPGVLEWRLLARRCTIEMTADTDAKWLYSDAIKGFLQGLWSRDDPSYERPFVTKPKSEGVRW